MTEYSPDFAAHLEQDVTTLCHCWRLTRRDGTVFGFTDHDRALAVDGTGFQPDSGLTASEAKSSLGMAVDTVDVEGALTSLDISEDDIAAGLYDGAEVETLLVNWRDTAQFARLRKAVIGKVTRRDRSFVAELESPMAILDRPNGRTVRRRCDAELGDGRCGFDLQTPGFQGAGSVAEAAGNGILVVNGLDAFEAGWFANGILTWTSGASATRAERVADHSKGAAGVGLVLWREGTAVVSVGDTFTIAAGCDKRFATCKAKFANAVNFRGFPHLPGDDAAYSYVNEAGNFDGGPLVE